MRRNSADLDESVVVVVWVNYLEKQLTVVEKRRMMSRIANDSAPTQQMHLYGQIRNFTVKMRKEGRKKHLKMSNFVLSLCLGTAKLLN
ncbi:hypothetical protein ACFX1W_006500 [Malus domestica]